MTCSQTHLPPPTTLPDSASGQWTYFTDNPYRSARCWNGRAYARSACRQGCFGIYAQNRFSTCQLTSFTVLFCLYAKLCVQIDYRPAYGGLLKQLRNLHLFLNSKSKSPPALRVIYQDTVPAQSFCLCRNFSVVIVISLVGVAFFASFSYRLASCYAWSGGMSLTLTKEYNDV